jgi:ribonuclease J
MIKIHAFGGYSKIGKSMTAIDVDGEIILTDMGADIEKLVNFEDDKSYITIRDTDALIENGVIPDDRRFFEEEGKKVKAIVLTHGHLDHIWAVPFLASKYKCPVIATPFTIKVVEHLMKNVKQKGLRIKMLNTGTKYKISQDLTLEFVNITHSIPNSVLAVIHTNYGAVVYANDWKFDDTPTLGRKPDYDRMEVLGKEGVHTLILDSTNVDQEGYTFSESVVRTMLEDVIKKTLGNKTIFITTFSSHIARIKNIVEISRKLNRQVLIFGRSMAMYIKAAIDTKTIEKSKFPEVATKRENINNILKFIKNKPGKYVIICTGHQGEKGAFLDRLATGQYEYRLGPEDAVIFSSRVIPTPLNIANRSMLQNALEETNANIADNVHVSGHASKNEHKIMLKLLKPRHYIPSHGGMDKISAGIEMAKELGYELNKTSHILLDGQELIFE